jgi:four helix bundle protein
MVRICRFEDIEAWKEARILTGGIYGVTRCGNLANDYGLRDQLRRSAVSIMANIAEGFDSGSHREFHRFLSYALRSASELQSHLYVAMDQSYLSAKQFQELHQQTVTVKNLVIGFLRYLRAAPRQPL